MDPSTIDDGAAPDPHGDAVDVRRPGSASEDSSVRRPGSASEDPGVRSAGASGFRSVAW